MMKRIIFILIAAIIITACQSPQEKLNKLGYSYSSGSFLDLFESYTFNDTISSDDRIQLEALKIFLDNGILNDSLVKNELNENGIGFISAAMFSSRIELLDVLYEKNIWNKDTINRYNLLNTAINLYCEEQNTFDVNIDIIKYLINKDVDVNQLSKGGLSLLFISIRDNKSELTKLLLNNGANPDVGYVENKNAHLSPVIAAIGLNKPDVLKLLIEHNAKLNEINKKDGFNVLMTAIDFSKKSDDFPMVKTLVEADKSLLNHKSKSGKTALLFAIDFKRYDMAEYLLKSGANPNFTFEASGFKAPSLFLLSETDHKGAELLLKYGADINGKVFYKGKSLSLMEAAKKFNLKKAITFLNKHSANSSSSNLSNNSNRQTHSNSISYKSTATLNFEVYDNVSCISKSNLRVSAIDNYCVFNVDSYNHTATLGGGSSDKGVKGKYKFSWSLINDCGLSTPSSSDYKNYSGTFSIDGLHNDYFIEVYDSYIKVRSN